MDREAFVATFAPGLIAAVLAVTPLLGCATGSDGEDSTDREVVGAPPDQDDEDYEFAPPPSHPGEHGDVTADSGPVETSPDPGTVTRSEIEELRRYGPSVVMEHVETEPTYGDDEEFVGFEITGVSDEAREILEPKLEVGDVVTHVNLVRLEKPDDYMKAWETLEGADEIRVDVVRDGEDEEIVWDIR